MNWLDYLILVLLLAAVVRGVLQGAIMQVFPFGAFWMGLLLGSAMAPLVAGVVQSRQSKAVISLVVFFGAALILSGFGRQAGLRVLRAVHRTKLKMADALLGAGISGIATLIGVWLLGTVLAGLPLTGISRPINESAVVRTLDRVMPPAPQVFSRVRQLIGAHNFPDVFAGLEPTLAEPVPPPSDPEVRAALEAAGAATLKVVGVGCEGIKTGSGFVAAPGLVVTNAHVIAGIDRPTVEEGGRTLRTTPVLFDKDLDIAVLRVAGVGAGPLPLRNGLVDRGNAGAVIGYPGGGPLTAGAGAVMARFDATGRDIYGQSLTSRNVYQLQAQVRPGNSGGPFVRSDGEVLGVIFSSSATNPDVGYAITTPEVIPRVQEASGRQDPVDTGPCTA